MSRKKTQKRIIKIFIDYGIHLTILFFICNIVLIYALHFFLYASTTKTTTPANNTKSTSTSAQLTVSLTPQAISPTITTAPTITLTPTPYPTAIGPLFSINFSLPGIGTNGGNLKPLHPLRDVNIFLYSADANTSDKNIKPLYTIKSTVTYDIDPNSPTYALYANQHIDLGVIKEGQYQIALQTPQALRHLIKTNPKAPGGKIFDLSGNRLVEIPRQNLITGDIFPYPVPDNKMDINDYLLLQDCFGIKAKSSECPGSVIADLDDNGVVDGIDYNLMLINFRYLGSLGYPIPRNLVPTKIPVSPVLNDPMIKAKLPLPTIVPKLPDVKVKSKSSPAGAIAVIFLLIIIGGGIFAAYKFHLIDLIKNRNNTDKNSPDSGSDQNAEAATSEDSATEEQAPQENTSNTEPTDNADTTIDQGQPPQPDDSNLIVKSGYLKVISTDKDNGTWVTVADDNGISKGYYKGANVRGGFVKIKGTREVDKDNKEYIIITEIQPED